MRTTPVQNMGPWLGFGNCLPADEPEQREYKECRLVIQFNTHYWLPELAQNAIK